MSKRKDNKSTQDYECEILKVEENRTEKLSIQAQHERLEHERYSYSNTKITNNNILKHKCYDVARKDERKRRNDCAIIALVKRSAT